MVNCNNCGKNDHLTKNCPVDDEQEEEFVFSNYQEYKRCISILKEEQDIKCSICDVKYSVKVVLECKHILCLDCLLSMITKSVRFDKCPYCRRHIKFPKQISIFKNKDKDKDKDNQMTQELCERVHTLNRMNENLIECINHVFQSHDDTTRIDDDGNFYEV